MPESAFSFHHKAQAPCQPQAQICYTQMPSHTILSKPISLLSRAVHAAAVATWRD